MFKFDDLDRMGRLEMLSKQMECQREWKSVYELKKLWNSFGADTFALMEVYKPFVDNQQLVLDLQKVAGHGKNKGSKIEKYLLKLDEYMRELDARLADGSKWYTASEIAAMQIQRDGEAD